MQKWEYKTIKVKTTGLTGGILDTTNFDGVLNQAGIDGWELVSVLSTNMAYGSSREVVAVFKRLRI